MRLSSEVSDLGCEKRLTLSPNRPVVSLSRERFSCEMGQFSFCFVVLTYAPKLILKVPC